jgi:predicted ATPase/class 3 adenylate cyclase
VSGRPSGTVTFVFTDIQGSTTLWEADPVAMRAALARHDLILEEAIVAHDGLVFSRGGDGVAAAFRRAGDALAAAVDAQRALTTEAWPQAAQIRVRIGLDTGEAFESDGDYHGTPVNRAARLMAAAGGGQIVVSEVTASLLATGPGIALKDLGLQRLRGLSQPVHAFGVVADGVVAIDRPLATADTPGNLPSAANGWFGSTAELNRRVADLRGRRLVTLTGTGGVGKTRLAVEIGSLASDEFPGGVWLVELAPIADPTAVVMAVTSTLSVQTQFGVSAVDSIVGWLRGRRVLLIIDNCEHVVTPVADLCAAIVAGCPETTVLATSREPLGVPGERVVSVASLTSSDGIELFCDRASAADEAVLFAGDDLTAVASICERLDGIPLAIELAAARCRAMALGDLLARLDDRFRLLRGGGRGGLERHQTLRATVSWSYQMLNEDERVLFDRVSVFAGGFDLAAAEAVCADEMLDPSEIVDVLGSLVDKSMVLVERGPSAVRYRLFETLRQYGEERLEGDTSRFRDHHLEHYLAVAEAAHRLWMSPRQREGDAAFDREWDNMRAAWVWAMTTEDVDAADALIVRTGPYANFRNRHEHGDWATRTLGLETAERHPSPTTYGEATFWAFVAGDLDRAVAVAERGIRAGSGPEDVTTTWCWVWLAFAHLASGRRTDAEEASRCALVAAGHVDPFIEGGALGVHIDVMGGSDPAATTREVDRHAELSRQLGAPSVLAMSAHIQARNLLAAQDSSRVADALVIFQRGLMLARETGAVLPEALNLQGVASVAALLDVPEAGDVCRDAIARFYETRNWSVLWQVLDSVASWLARTGDVEFASVLYGHLIEYHPPWGSGPDSQMRDDGVAIVRHHEQATEWMREGSAMSADELVAYALSRLAPRAP